MAIKRRLNPYSGFRLDVPHVRSVESAVSNDFDEMLRGLVTGLNQPYLIRGFRIKIPTAAIPASSLQIEVADTAVLHSSAGESGTIFTIPVGTPDIVLDANNARVQGAFQNGVPNYVSVELRRGVDAETVDQTAGWSAAQELEFQRTVPIGRVLDYRIIINTTGFATNLPLYIVKTSNTGAVEYITKAVGSLFRLGSGGSVPNPANSFLFRSLINSQAPNARQEWVNQNPNVPNPVSVEPNDPAQAFDYGDWSIRSLKEWMDAVMTRIKEITGSAYWYFDSNSPTNQTTINQLFFDSGAGSVLTGSGELSYNLILEANNPSLGGFQSQFTDSGIAPGDSYVEGQTSRTKATITSFNGTQLVINSLTNQNGYIFGEALWNRRIFRFNPAVFEMVDTVQAPNRQAVFYRKAGALGAGIAISSFSYTNTAGGSLVTINTAAPHGLEVGDLARLEDIDMSPALADPLLRLQGTRQVKHVGSTTSFQVLVPFPLVGTTVLGAFPLVKSDTGGGHPYMPRFAIDDISGAGFTNIGLAVTVRVPGHSLTIGQTIVVAGLSAASDAPNGRWVVSNIVSDQVTFNVTTVPGAANPPSNAYVQYDTYTLPMTISDAAPAEYNKIDTTVTVFDDTTFRYVVGADTLPALSFAAGAIRFDGVVAVSTVQDPVNIQSINYVNATTLQVNTYTNHGLSSATNTALVLFSSIVHPYLREYINVNISVITPTQFQIIANPPDTFANMASYVNPAQYPAPGADDSFVKFSNNPYPGPIAWTSDMIVKGIIGDLAFVVPQTATAVGTTKSNIFNTNGQTGTAYLLDKEVAYIELKRNKLASSGSFFSCAGGASPIIGSSVPLDEEGNPLEVGDYVRFEGEDDSYWLKVVDSVLAPSPQGTPLASNTFYLMSDGGVSPTGGARTYDGNEIGRGGQRPSAQGKLLYCKGTYPVVKVAKHWQVSASTDNYWLAVRRDNFGRTSKVYFRSLELEAGEVRSINDNEMSNLLVYTGAISESAVNPNYTLSSPGIYGEAETVNITAKTLLTRVVEFAAAPALGFQKGDVILQGANSFVVYQVLTERTVVMTDDVAAAVVGSASYRRVNRKINDSDNLTVALRKEDREIGRIDTVLTRPLYDERHFLQQANFSASASDIKSGTYLYQGPQTNPSALAWVMHGTAATVATIEGNTVTMPGGHPSIGSNGAIIHIISGAFTAGALYQDGAIVSGRTLTNSASLNSNDSAVPIAAGVEFVFQPNRRTQIVGSSYVKFGAPFVYRQNSDPSLTGEELMVVINDTIRQATIDYNETFGGPHGKIQILRALPDNTTIRARSMSSVGSAIAAQASGVTLQLAYNGGKVIDVTTGFPIQVNSTVPNTQQELMRLTDGFLTLNNSVSDPDKTGIRPTNDLTAVVGTEARRFLNSWLGTLHVKTHNGWPASAFTQKTAADQSIGAAATYLNGAPITLDDNTAYRVCATFVGRENTGLGVAAFRVEGTFYRAGGGAVIAGDVASMNLGAFGEAIPSPINIGYAATLTVVGNQVVPTVYGVSTAVQWACVVDYQAVAQSS